MILQHRTCYMSAKGFGSSKQIPKCPSLVNDPKMQELEHYRARANDLQKAQEEQPEEIKQIPKELQSLELFGLLVQNVQAPTQTHASQSRQNHFWKG